MSNFIVKWKNKQDRAQVERTSLAKAVSNESDAISAVGRVNGLLPRHLGTKVVDGVTTARMSKGKIEILSVEKTELETLVAE